jgi:hypothetical protein
MRQLEGVIVYLATEGQDVEPWVVDALCAAAERSPHPLPLSTVRAIHEALQSAQETGSYVLAAG